MSKQRRFIARLAQRGGIALLGVIMCGLPSLVSAHSARQVTGNVVITCSYFSDTDRQFDVTLEQRPGGAPTGTATLTLVSGGTQAEPFTSNRLTYRGPYLSLSVNARWPDGASGFASATCGQQVPTATLPPTMTSTVTAVPPTATLVPEAATATATTAAATATAVAATATVEAPTRVAATATARVATATAEAATATAVAATATVEAPTRAAATATAVAATATSIAATTPMQPPASLPNTSVDSPTSTAGPRPALAPQAAPATLPNTGGSPASGGPLMLIAGLGMLALGLRLSMRRRSQV